MRPVSCPLRSITRWGCAAAQPLAGPRLCPPPCLAKARETGRRTCRAIVLPCRTKAEAFPVEVKVNSVGDTILIVGLPDAAVKESRDWVTTALNNSGFKFPMGRCTINLAPAEVGISTNPTTKRLTWRKPKAKNRSSAPWKSRRRMAATRLCCIRLTGRQRTNQTTINEPSKNPSAFLPRRSCRCGQANPSSNGAFLNSR